VYKLCLVAVSAAFQSTRARAIGRQRVTDFEGKVALITGGTRGLGRAIALRLAAAGATIALNYRRDEASARTTLEEVRVYTPGSILIKADMEDDAQVRAMAERAGEELGRIDILVVNAAA